VTDADRLELLHGPYEEGLTMPPGRPPLTVAQILAWADSHHARTGRWPITTSGPVPDHPGEEWVRIDAALRRGLGGLPGGDSLARLLAERRGRRLRSRKPPRTVGGDQVVRQAHGPGARRGRGRPRGAGPGTGRRGPPSAPAAPAAGGPRRRPLSRNRPGRCRGARSRQSFLPHDPVWMCVPDARRAASSAASWTAAWELWPRTDASWATPTP
jgi:hypothetical protein